MSKVYIQLYSIRELLGQDFLKTLDLVKNIGYDGVEFAGLFGGLSAKDMKNELRARELTPISAHVSMDLLETNLSESFSYFNEVGCEHIVCPYLDLKTADDTKKFAEKLNNIGKQCVENGFTFSYHNHAHEFKKDNGLYLLDILYDNCSPDFVKAQIDVFWVAKGGEDPYAYIKKYADRMELVHLKQISKDGENVDAPFGIIDFKKVVDLTNNAHVIYEQEGLTVENGEESIKNSLIHLKKIL